MSQEHGQKTKLGRWCATCGHEHGPLYSCEHYPEDVRAEIALQASSWQASLGALSFGATGRGIPADVAVLALDLQRLWAGMRAEP